MTYRDRYRHDENYAARGGRYGGGLRRSKAQGWGMNLYRNTRRGRIAGVAAGLADNWDVAPWVVRLLWVGAFIFTGTLALWVYLGAWLLLAPRPSEHRFGRGYREEEPAGESEVEVEMEYSEKHREYRPRKVFQYSEPTTERLNRARERLDAALERVQAMETYVTSRRYKLNREFSRL